MIKTVAFRTKGNHKQGMGDLTGSVSLAKEFSRNGYDVVFAIDHDVEAIDFLNSEHYRYYTFKEKSEAEVWGEIGTVDITIVNQLNTSRDTLSVIKKYSKKLVTIDDTGKPSKKLADLRINPLYYDDGAVCNPKYIPLNPIFQEAHRNLKTINEDVKTILVTLGGSDTYGFTPKVVKYLSGMNLDIRINILLGPAFRHYSELNEVLSQNNKTFEVLKAVNTNQMCQLISHADLVICSGGNTMFEVACLGRPAIIVCGEPFEEETAQRFMDMGIVINLGFGKNISEKNFQRAIVYLISNPIKRKQMGLNGYKIIDGKGVERIYQLIVSNE